MPKQGDIMVKKAQNTELDVDLEDSNDTQESANETSIPRSSRTFVRPDGRPMNPPKFIKAHELFDEGVKGPILEGTFEGTSPNRFNKNKLDFKFIDDQGTHVTINAAGNLGARMKKITVGDYCQVSYLGKYPIKEGDYKGTLCHSFDVLVAE